MLPITSVMDVQFQIKLSHTESLQLIHGWPLSVQFSSGIVILCEAFCLLSHSKVLPCIWRRR